MRICLLLFFFTSFILQSFQSFSQTFLRTYGDLFEDDVQIILPAIDGGYIMMGSKFTAAGGLGESNILIVKTDTSGFMQWSETIGTPADDQGFWMETCPDNTYLICGNTYDNVTGKLDVSVIRLNQTGAILFQKIYTVNNGERVSCIRRTNDGGFIVCGETATGGVDLDMFIFKADSTGSVEWSKSFGDNEQETGRYIMPLSDGGYIVAGEARYGLTWNSIYVVRTDSIGNRLWSYKYNTHPYLSRCDVSRILKTDDGGFVISGATSANQPLKSIVLLKIDSLGSSVWQRLYTTGGGERNNDIVDDETGYVICGSTGTSNGTDNLLLMKTDYSGNLLWQLAYGDSVSNIIGYSMIRNKNKFVIAAYADGYGAGESDFMLVKSDSVYDNSLCHMGMPQLLQDTVTLSDSLILGSASVVTTPSPGSFSVMPGVGETLICNFTLGVSKIEDNSIRMFPNPVNESGTITIELNKASELNMEIINVDGKKIFTFSDQSLAKKHIVHPDIFKSISSGIYFLKIITPESTFSSKFIFEGGN